MLARVSLGLVALVRDVEWERHIADTLGRSCSIRWIRDGDELEHSVGLASADIALWHLEPGIGAVRTMPSTLQRIRVTMPVSTVIIYCRVAPEIARLVLAAGRLGVDRVGFRGYDDLGRVIADALHERRYANAVEHILARLAVAEGPALPILSQVIRHTLDSPLGVEDLARELGVDRKTLNNRLRAAGLPSPAALISWSRLFAAGWLLDDPTQTVASVGRALQFASASELRGMLTRYVHVKPTDLREHGALDTIIEAFHTVTLATRIESARL